MFIFSGKYILFGWLICFSLVKNCISIITFIAANLLFLPSQQLVLGLPPPSQPNMVTSNSKNPRWQQLKCQTQGFKIGCVTSRRLHPLFYSLQEGNIGPSTLHLWPTFSLRHKSLGLCWTDPIAKWSVVVYAPDIL